MENFHKYHEKARFGMRHTTIFQNISILSVKDSDKKRQKNLCTAPEHQYAFSPHYSVYVSNGTDEENLFDKQVLPQLEILLYSHDLYI